MTCVDFLTEIKQCFSPAESPALLAALRQDGLVWQSLSRAEIWQKAIPRLGSRLEAWTPAYLGLLALGSDCLVEDLRGEAPGSLPPELQKQVLGRLEKIEAPQDLSQAMLLALALYDRRQGGHSWQEICSDFLYPADWSDAQCFVVWQTPLACLAGILAEPQEMLAALLAGKRFQVARQWVNHVIFSNSFLASEQIRILFDLLLAFPLAQQLEWLRELSLTGRAGLATQLAQTLLAANFPSLSSTSLLAQNLPDEADLDAALPYALGLQRVAALHQLANNSAKSIALLRRAQGFLHSWLAAIQVQMADAASANQQPDAALLAGDQALKLAPLSGRIQNELAMIAGNCETVRGIFARPGLEWNSPMGRIWQAGRLAQAGELLSAQRLAQPAIEQWLQLATRQPHSLPVAYASGWNPLELIQTLQRLKLYPQAIDAAQLVLGLCPSDAGLYGILSELLLQCGENEQALQYARLAVALDPQSVTWRRLLGELWEKAHEWPLAYEERHNVVGLLPYPEPSDWLALANSAAHIGQHEQVVTACRHVLEHNPQQQQAIVLLGKALVSLGDYQGAIPYLEQSTQITPEDERVWLTLADLRLQIGNAGQSLNTLREAARLRPASEEIALALADAYLRAGQHTEALPYLRQAAILSPHSPQISLLLGRTLRTLGYLADALQVLEPAFQEWPQDSDLALELGRVLIEVGNPLASLPVLEVALQADQPDVDAYLLYARTLVGSGMSLFEARPQIDLANLAKSQQALQKALALAPGQFEIQLLLAEVLVGRGENPAAFDLYQRLHEHPMASLPAWRWRIQAGLGQVAYGLAQWDTAVAALHEAALERPENASLLRMLTEAYRATGLTGEASSSARCALQLAPDDLGMLDWYVERMIEFGLLGEAIAALKTMTQLEPRQAGHWIRLAELAHQNGDTFTTRAALETLVAMEGLPADVLQRAGHLFLAFNDLLPGLSCLERAVEASSVPSASMLFEIAYLHQRLGDLSSALVFAQNALQAAPSKAWMYVFQADLLMLLKRPQAALAALERAAQIEQSAPGSLLASEQDASLLGEWRLARWLRGPLEQVVLASLHLRFALLHRQSGNLDQAYSHAEDALRLYPADLILRHVAADLAAALSLNDRSAEIVDEAAAAWDEWPALAETEAITGLGRWQHSALVEMACLRAELALDRDEELVAGEWVARVASRAAQHEHVRLLQVRLLCRQGDRQAALTGYNALTADGKTRPTAELIRPAQLNSLEQMTWEGLAFTDAALWLAEAALEMEKWRRALRQFNAYLRNFPAEPRAYLRTLRAYVYAAEQQRLCTALRAVAHAPGEASLSGAAYEAFEQIVADAGKVCTALDLARWQWRGRAAFHPVIQNVRPLANLTATPDDTAALVSILRQLNNLAGAAQAARRFPNASQVLMQLALCYLENDPAQGAEIARRAVEAAPVNPLAHATMALLAEHAGRSSLALQSLEMALLHWADEPVWHSWAARLASRLERRDIAIQHFERAIALRPEQIDDALALAELSRQDGNAGRALEILERASRLAPERVDVWLELAQTYLQSGRLREAMESAGRAGNLQPDLARPLLLGGEIALQLNQPEKALKYARSALGRAPEDASVVLFVVQVLKRLDKPTEALATVEKALPALQHVFELQMERVRLVYQVQGAQAALPLLNDLGQQNPHEAQVFTLLARARAEAGDGSGAEKAARTALRLRPEQAEMHLLLGRLQRSAGQLDQAILHLSEAARLDPDHLEAYLELGQAYQERREYVQAVRVYQRAVKVAPQDSRAYYQAGMLLRDSKDYAGAESMLRRAAELCPDDANIRRLLAGVITLNLVHNS